MGLFLDSWLQEAGCLLALLMALFYYYFTNTKTFWKNKGVPYIEPEFFFGNMREILTFKKCQPEVTTGFYNYFKGKGYDYGGIFLLRQPLLFVVSPETIKDVFLKSFSSFHDRGLTYDENFDPLSANLILLDGAKWKYLRAKLTPTFTTGKLKSMMGLMKQAGEVLVKVMDDHVKTGDDCDMRDVTAKFTTDVIGYCAFGLQLNSLEGDAAQFRKMGAKIFENTEMEKIQQNLRNVFPWLYRLLKFRLFKKEVSDFFIDNVNNTMRERREKNIQRNDVLQTLMTLRDTKVTKLKTLDGEELKGIDNYNDSVQEGALELTDSIIAAQAFVFFMAGFETTSTTLGFCLMELGQHPEIQELMSKEVDEVLKKHGEFTYEALQDLKYTQQVIDETLRLYPPVTMLLRECTKTWQIPGTDSHLHPGDKVYIPLWSVHHDEQYYPEPYTFNPDRWSDEGRANMTPYTFFPFGEGPRICLGLRFAYMEMKLALALLLRSYRFGPCPKTKPFSIDKRAFVLAPEHGVWLKVTKRPESN